ncbi:misp3 [Pungitius sinensis]
MATKPVEWQEQGRVNSLYEWAEELWPQGEEPATLSHNSPLQDKDAPRAQPEEDNDLLEPGAQDQTPRSNQAPLGTKTSSETKSENPEHARIGRCFPTKTLRMGTELDGQLFEKSQAQEEKSGDSHKAAFQTPPLSASSMEKCFEKDSLSSLTGELDKIMLDPIEDLSSPDGQNGLEWPPLSQPTNTELDALSKEKTTEENDTQLNFLPDGFDYSEPENKMSDVAPGSNSAAHSPPFNRINGAPITTLDIEGKSFHPSHSANTSVSTEQDPTSTLPAFLSAKPQGELLPQSQRELSPMGGNQEATQQVLGKSASPLSTVAMQPPDRGGAGSGFAAAVRERHSRAGDRTLGRSTQAGAEGPQIKTVEQQRSRELSKNCKTVEKQKIEIDTHCPVSGKHTRMESDSCDDSQSDSGVSADFSPCSTLEGTTISTACAAAVPNETPIEREMRRAVEREHSLRRSRGLPNPPTSPEYVEIPLRKTILCESVTKSERSQGKDRQLAGKKMEQEIHKEAEREQDLVKLGKVQGFYDKGTVRQIKERKQIFEAFQKPSDSTLSVSARSKATSWSSASDISNLENQEDISSQASTIGGSYMPTQSTSSVIRGGDPARTLRGPGSSEGMACQVIILESNLSVPAQKLCHAKLETGPITVVTGSPRVSSSRTGGRGGIRMREQEEEEEEEEPKENPFFKLRSSTNLVKVEQDIRETQEREKELHKQRASLYGGTGEQEGRGTPVPTSSTSPSLNGLAVPDSPGSSSTGGTRSPAAHQSVGKLGLWPPAQAKGEGKEKIDQPESPRTPRHKSPLVQRWESGLVNGHNVEDN